MAPRAKKGSTAGVQRETVSVALRRNGVRELSHAPQPFMDWTLVEPGAITWVNARGEAVSDPATPDEQIAPVQLGAPLGVRLAVQPATTAPLFRDETPWETQGLPGASAMADDDLYRLWYHGAAGLLYAQSADGLAWTRPLIDFVPYASHHSTNLLPPLEGVNGRTIAFHEGIIFRDPHGSAEECYKALFPGSVTAEELAACEETLGPASPAARAKKRVLFGAASPDGFSWTMQAQPVMLHAGDAGAAVAYDAALGRYVGFFRGLEPGRRTLGRAETEDFWAWPLPTTVFAPHLGDGPGVEVLNAAYAAYPGNHDIKLLFPTLYDAARDRTEVRLAMSRDGVAWRLVPGGPLIAPGAAGAFDEGSVLANHGLLYSPEQQLALLYTGSNRPATYPRTAGQRFRPGSACWREERLTALEAPERGEFTTVPLLLRGPAILLNCHTDRVGEVRLELRDRHFRPLPGKSFADADSLTGDHLWTPATWRGAADLSALVGQIIYLRFRLRWAKLYAVKTAK